MVLVADSKKEIRSWNPAQILSSNPFGLPKHICELRYVNTASLESDVHSIIPRLPKLIQRLPIP